MISFTLAHNKAETFSTNLFIWYGQHNLGLIRLKRAEGVLNIQINPAAASLYVRGTEFTNNWTNSTGITLRVPTDHYVVDAKYLHWTQHNEVVVSDRQTNTVSIAPRLGAISLKCNREGASFELINAENYVVASGEIPTTVLDVPEGGYKLIARHHRARHELTAVATFNKTNELHADFAYGSASLITEPSGASVISSDGHNWGVTPLNLSELPVGVVNLELQLDGYESRTTAVNISEDNTTTLRTNLVSRNYLAAMSAAEQYFGAGNYVGAEKAANEALLAKRDDPAAAKLLGQARGFAFLRQAESLGNRGDFIAGIKELEKALALLPDNLEAEQMLAQFKTREPEQREKLKGAREVQVRKAFNNFARLNRESQMFETHEIRAKKSATVVAKAIEDIFWNSQPRLAIARRDSPSSGIYMFEAVQTMADGYRSCLIGISAVDDNELLIMYKILEYKNSRNFIVDTNFRVTMPVEHIPLNPNDSAHFSEKQKAQFEEGQRLVEQCLQRAIE